MVHLNRRQIMGGALAGGLSLFASGQAPAIAGEAQTPDLPPNGVLVSEPRLKKIRRVIIDTDPGNDDATALLLALDAPSLQVEAITVCPGNMGPEYEQQVRNALYIVEVAGYAGKVPVFAGMAHPILNRPYPVATFIHGKYGLGRVEVPTVKQKVENEHAVDTIRRIVRQHPGEVTLLALGAWTNIAMAILRDPEIVPMIQGIHAVAGRYAWPGFAQSYNILADPEAAHVVLGAGIPITMVGADVVNHYSIFTDAEFDEVAKFNTARSRFFMESNDLRRTFEKQHRGTAGSTNPDPIATAIALDPAIGQQFASVNVRVELQGELTRGLMVYGYDIYEGHPTPEPNVDICIQADAERFRSLVFATLKKS